MRAEIGGCEVGLVGEGIADEGEVEEMREEFDGGEGVVGLCLGLGL